MNVVSRFAPSPTGLLHVGHARTFLLAWWNALSQGGSILLRLEDLDRSRCSAEYSDACHRDLEWLGLTWDGKSSHQSERSDELRAALEELLSREMVFPCVCTRSEVQAAIAAPHAEDASAVYPGTCRGLFNSLAEAQRVSGREAALRFKCPDEELRFKDGLLGDISLSPKSDFGDFPVTSRDGHPAYHLAVSVDDASQGVTEVLRADDLLTSCGPQAALQASLGLPRPNWIHVPMVLDANRQRLAKRSDALSLQAMREAGVDPKILVRWLSDSCGLGDLGAVTPREALPSYELAKLPLQPYVLPHDFLSKLCAGELPSKSPA
jgi:glutamyl-tRNA synthetase